MEKIIKTILALLGLLLASIILLITFSEDESKKMKDIINIDGYVGYREILLENSKISFNNTDSLLVGKTIQQKINKSDSIFFNLTSEDNISLSTSGDNYQINLGKGIFLFDINDVKKSYTISSNDFDIFPMTKGKFYIHLSEDKKLSFFSLDSVFRLRFKENKDQDLYIFPHLLYSFDVSKISYFKGFNYIGFSPIYSSEYIFSPMLNKIDPNEDFLAIINEKFGQDSKDLFEKASYLFLDRDKEVGNYIENISKMGIKDITGIQYINKYFSFFLNDEKKVIYYKNKVLSDINKAINKNQISLEELKQIKGGIESLKSVSKNGYDEMIEIIELYYLVFDIDNSINNLEKKYVISKIIEDSLGRKIGEEYTSLGELNTIFQSLNNQKVSKKFFDYLSDNSEDFIKDLDLDPKKKNNLLSFYYSYFLLLLLESNIDNIYTNPSLSNVLNDYLEVSTFYYSSSEDKEEKKIYLSHNLDLLNNIKESLRKIYFTKPRDPNSLLVINRSASNSITEKDIVSIGNTINEIFKVYNSNKNLLSNSDNVDTKISSDYDNFKKILDEYILALTDYTQYSIKYSKMKDIFLGAGNIILTTKNNNIELTRENFLSYIGKFNGVDIKTLDLEIDTVSNYYNVKNLVVGGANFSFKLYPSQNNTIKSITKRGKNITGSYVLDDLEEASEKILKDFFINVTDDISDNSTPEIYEDELAKQEEEDIFTSKFKENKLLGEHGEFSIISEDLLIDYSNIGNIKENNRIYYISINSVSIKNLSGLNFYATYILSDKSHYFKDIKIKTSDGNTKVVILGNVRIQDISNILDIFTKGYSKVNPIYENLKYSKGVMLMAIDYNPSKKSFTIKGSYNSKKFEVSYTLLASDDIKLYSIKVDGKNKSLGGADPFDIIELINK